MKEEWINVWHSYGRQFQSNVSHRSQAHAEAMRRRAETAHERVVYRIHIRPKR